MVFKAYLITKASIVQNLKSYKDNNIDFKLRRDDWFSPGKAVKLPVLTLYEKGLFVIYNNADEILKDY